MAGEKWEIRDMDGLADAVRRLGEDDLRKLNLLVVERLKLIHQAKSTGKMAEFSIGDRVAFLTDDGDHKGIIQRLNKKTASILTDDGHRWNVHPGFLTKLWWPSDGSGR